MANGGLWDKSWYRRKKAMPHERYRNANTGEVAPRPHGGTDARGRFEFRHENVYGGDHTSVGRRTLTYTKRRNGMA